MKKQSNVVKIPGVGITILNKTPKATTKRDAFEGGLPGIGITILPISRNK